MEATIGILWDYIIMENKMEATIGILWDYIIVEIEWKLILIRFFARKMTKRNLFRMN